MRKRNILLLVLLLAMAAVTYTQAWSITPLTQESSFFQAETQESDRTITDFRSRPLGKNKILITFELTSGSQNANITLQPLDEWGNILNSTGPGSKIKYSVGSGVLKNWRSYPVPDTEMMFYYEYNSTHPDFPGETEVSVLFQISDIVVEYETVLIEVEDYN
ncbi:hypothetical protein JXL21_08855 [Candidatus Bathyarchaeota archaeon]|nr:hypothetical protein [Candidatus Bathyarchaeota archaeon]